MELLMEQTDPKDYRHWQAVSEGLRGPFGRWLMTYLKDTIAETAKNAIALVPANLEEQNEREQMFGRVNALTELIDSLPTAIKDKLQETQQQEVDKVKS